MVKIELSRTRYRLLYKFIPADNWDSFESDLIETGSLTDDIELLLLLLLLLIANNNERPCTYVDFDKTDSLLYAISQIKKPPA
jgi:hypothetical protein